MNEKETNVLPKAPPKPQANEKPKSNRKMRRRWVRIVLWMLRALLVPVLCAAALIVGLWIGYAYIGGKGAGDVWEWATWRHAFDLVFGS